MHKNTFAKTIHKQHYVSNFFNNLNSIEKNFNVHDGKDSNFKKVQK